MKPQILFAIPICIIANLVTPVFASATIRYSVIDIGQRIPGASVQGYGINASGEIAGVVDTGGGPHAFLWNGTLHDLTPGMDSEAWGVDVHGNVYGNSVGPFIWNGSFFFLPYPPGSNNCALEGFNNNSVVVGSCNYGPHSTRPFIYENGKSHLFGPINSDSAHINDEGDRVVQNSPSNYILEESGWRQYLEKGFNPWRINNNRVVAGTFQLPGIHHGGIFERGKYIDVGELPGYPNTELNSVNLLGAAVGGAQSNSSSYIAIYYDRRLGLVDLNTLIDPHLRIVLAFGEDINDSGQIVANDRASHCYLLTPIKAAPNRR